MPSSGPSRTSPSGSCPTGHGPPTTEGRCSSCRCTWGWRTRPTPSPTPTAPAFSRTSGTSRETAIPSDCTPKTAAARCSPRRSDMRRSAFSARAPTSRISCACAGGSGCTGRRSEQRRGASSRCACSGSTSGGASTRSCRSSGSCRRKRRFTRRASGATAARCISRWRGSTGAKATVPSDARIVAHPRGALRAGRYDAHRLGGAPRHAGAGRRVPPADRRPPRGRTAVMDALERVCPSSLRRHALDAGARSHALRRPGHQLHRHRPGEQGAQRLRAPLRRPGRRDDFERAVRGLRPVPVAGPRRHQDAGLQQQQALGHGLRHRRRILGGRSRRTASHAAMLERAYGYLRDNQILEDVPDHERYYRHRVAGRLALLEPARTAGRSPTAPPRGSSARSRSTGASTPAIPEALLRDAVRADPVVAERRRRLGDLRAAARRRLARGAQPVAGLRRHHGRLLVRRVHERVPPGAREGSRDRGSPTLAAPRSTAPSPAGRASSAARSGPTGASRARWAVCFTYGTWFGVTGLLAGGALGTTTRRSLRACAFLLEQAARRRQLGRARRLLPRAPLHRGARGQRRCRPRGR